MRHTALNVGTISFVLSQTDRQTGERANRRTFHSWLYRALHYV